MKAPAVRYVKTSDGFDIAYTSTGRGTPFVFMAEPFYDVQMYWDEETFYTPWLEGLVRQFNLIQFDGRGQGLSTRGLSEAHSILDELCDFEAVTDALELDKLVIMGRTHAALLYAVEHPDRVLALVLRNLPTESLKAFALEEWESVFRLMRMFGKTADPSGTLRRIQQTVNRSDFIRRLDAWQASKLEEFVDQLTTPVLVLHTRGNPATSLEESTALVSSIPGAEMRIIEGDTYLGDAGESIQVICEFIQALGHSAGADAVVSDVLSRLSSREIEVLRLIVGGLSNPQIAEQLAISLNTVQRHVSNIFAKAGLRNRAEAVAFAVRNHLAD